MRLELSKVLQYTALNAAGIQTPKTIATVGTEQFYKLLTNLVKHLLLQSIIVLEKDLASDCFILSEGLREYVDGPSFEEPVDGITLIQQYIQAPEPYITRCEFIDGKFLYAVKVDTSEGFELCPADACQIDDLFCPAGESNTEVTQPKFEIIEGFNDPIIEKYEQFLKENNIKVAGIEFIRNDEGEIFTYDVNTNTNYNADAEKIAGKFGMLELANVLKAELEKRFAKVN